MSDKKLSVKYLDPSDLVPYINNAKNHSEKQISMIAASIKAQNGHCANN